ncbi:MAG: 30S ribosomal protein S20 [Acidobacteriota bacterium]
MANHKSALKRMRQSEVRRRRNRSHMSRMRTAVKALRAAIAEGNADSARELLGSTLSLVDHTAQKGVIHRNAASRTKSRLTRAVNGMA